MTPGAACNQLMSRDLESETGSVALTEHSLALGPNIAVKISVEPNAMHRTVREVESRVVRGGAAPPSSRRGNRAGPLRGRSTRPI